MRIAEITHWRIPMPTYAHRVRAKGKRDRVYPSRRTVVYDYRLSRAAQLKQAVYREGENGMYTVSRTEIRHPIGMRTCKHIGGRAEAWHFEISRIAAASGSPLCCCCCSGVQEIVCVWARWSRKNTLARMCVKIRCIVRSGDRAGFGV